jgi:hypothetical protein
MNLLVLSHIFGPVLQYEEMQELIRPLWDAKARERRLYTLLEASSFSGKSSANAQ